MAERLGDDLALVFAQMTLGVALVHGQANAERDRGQNLLAEVKDVFLRLRHNLGELPFVEAYLARKMAREGDRHQAIPIMRAAVDHPFREGAFWGGVVSRRVSFWRHCSITGMTVTRTNPRQ